MLSVALNFYFMDAFEVVIFTMVELHPATFEYPGEFVLGDLILETSLSFWMKYPLLPIQTKFVTFKAKALWPLK